MAALEKEAALISLPATVGGPVEGGEAVTQAHGQTEGVGGDCRGAVVDRVLVAEPVWHERDHGKTFERYLLLLLLFLLLFDAMSD